VETQLSSQLLTGPAGCIAAVLIGLVLAAAIKALASVLRTWIEQTSRTGRLSRFRGGIEPHQRGGIIIACGQLDERSCGGLGSDETSARHQQTRIEHE
jgi:hypothetical protein